MPDKLEELSMFFLVYNEEENINPLLDSAQKTAQEAAEKFDIFPVIYEGSTDRTREIVEQRGKENPNIRAVIQPMDRKGMGNAIRVGFENARYKHIFYADGDNQFDLTDFMQFVPYIDEPKVIAGYRIDRKDPKVRLFTSKVYNRIVGALFHPQERDVDCAFRYVHKEVLDKINLVCETGLGTTELLVKARKAGFPVMEIGVKHLPRQAGEPVFESRNPLNLFNFPKPGVVWDLLMEMRTLRKDLKNMEKNA